MPPSIRASVTSRPMRVAARAMSSTTRTESLPVISAFQAKGFVDFVDSSTIVGQATSMPEATRRCASTTAANQAGCVGNPRSGRHYRR